MNSLGRQAVRENARYFVITSPSLSSRPARGSTRFVSVNGRFARGERGRWHRRGEGCGVCVSRRGFFRRTNLASEATVLRMLGT